jgi:hypothetical protein
MSPSTSPSAPASPRCSSRRLHHAGGYNIDFLCVGSHHGAMINDARFPALCAKLGHADYWAATNPWPDHLGESADNRFRPEADS